jgi:2-isopropylmalate synthase
MLTVAASRGQARVLYDFVGVTTRAELAGLGIGPDHITAQTRAGRWQLSGIAVILHNAGLTRAELRRVALINCGPRAVLTSFTAIEQWGLRGWQRNEIHVLAPAGTSRPGLPGLVLHRIGDWTRADIVPARRLHRLAPALVIAASGFANPRPGCGLLAAAVQQRLLRPDKLRQALDAAPRTRHRVALRSAVADIAQGAEALSEIDFGRLCRRFELPPPTRQAIRTEPNGRRRYLDAQWRLPDGRVVAAEVDGALHLTPQRWYDDQLRQNELVIQGTIVLRFPSVIVRHEPELVAAQLRRMGGCASGRVADSSPCSSSSLSVSASAQAPLRRADPPHPRGVFCFAEIQQWQGRAMQTDDFHVFDTTLRDGAQREGITYSVADKLAVARLLDQVGVGFIEGGWPGAMPKDTEFFARAADGELALKHAVLVAFGATRKPSVRVEDDPQVQALLDSRAAVVTLVAKSDVWHVERALRTTLEENLAMVRDTVAFLRAEGRRVFLDCEHFFDGYLHDPDYGVRVLDAAAEAGADVGVLCDTNGGMLPMGVHDVVSDVRRRAGIRLGIHTQDDTGCAVANTLAAVDAGATHAQGTANGYGERAGNANIFSVIGGLVTKMGRDVLPDGCLSEMQRVAHAIAEIANLAPDTHAPYVGASAFAHKAGLHASAIKVAPEMYNHLDPTTVGNYQRILVTEMAGRASIELKARELGIEVADRPDVVSKVVERVKAREAEGWSYEAADASFELLLRDELGEKSDPFTVESYRVIVDRREDGAMVSEATVKVSAGGERAISTAEGNGPVNALDRALRKALERVYPRLAELELTDYKVRIMPGKHGTDAVTRVLIETSDHHQEWTTVGVHANVIEASWLALHDAVRFGLLP